MLGLTVNGVDVGIGTTAPVAAGSTFSLRLNYLNSTGQNVWFGFVFAGDDGVERLVGCVGAGGAFGAGGVTLTGLLSGNSSIFVPGRTVRALVVGRFGPSPSDGVCALRTPGGELDRAVVQGQRHLLTFVVQ